MSKYSKLYRIGALGVSAVLVAATPLGVYATTNAYADNDVEIIKSATYDDERDNALQEAYRQLDDLKFEAEVALGSTDSSYINMFLERFNQVRGTLEEGQTAEEVRQKYDEVYMQLNEYKRELSREATEQAVALVGSFVQFGIDRTSSPHVIEKLEQYKQDQQEIVRGQEGRYSQQQDTAELIKYGIYHTVADYERNDDINQINDKYEELIEADRTSESPNYSDNELNELLNIRDTAISKLREFDTTYYMPGTAADAQRISQVWNDIRSTFQKAIEDLENVTKTRTSTTPAPVVAESVDAVQATAVEGMEPSPALPAQVKVHYSDGSSRDVNVTWSVYDWASTTAGSDVSLTGTVEGETITASATVTITKAAITGVKPLEVVETASGVAPVLPAQVVAVYENNRTANVDVQWAEVDQAQYKVRAGGEFSVAGSVAGYDQPVSVTVRVAPATVEDIASVEVKTTATVKPALPENVTVQWSNGEQSSEAVVWEDVQESAYAQAGTFQVAGSVTLNGQVRQISALVTVEPKPAEPSEEQPKEDGTETPKEETVTPPVNPKDPSGEEEKSEEGSKPAIRPSENTELKPTVGSDSNATTGSVAKSDSTPQAKVALVKKAETALPDTGVASGLGLLATIALVAGLAFVKISRRKMS